MKGFVKKLKILAKVAIGRDISLRPDTTCNTGKFGSAYGSWDVAVDRIDSGSIVYSFGVGEDASFDLALIEKFNLIVHAFDPTPKSIAWVKNQRLSPKFIMHEYGIASFDGDVSFNPPVNPAHVSHTLLDRPATKSKAITVPVKEIKTIMSELNHDHIDILKMDIEGAEYDVIEYINQSNVRPKQILVEFHHRFEGVGISKTKHALKMITSMGYRLFAISDRNEEFGFILST